MLSRADIYSLHSHAQFEDDTLGNIQPVKIMMEDVTKTVNEALSDLLVATHARRDGGGAARHHSVVVWCWRRAVHG